MKITILSDLSGYISSINEEKAKWVNLYLEQLGFDLSVDKPILVERMLKQKIEIIEYSSFSSLEIKSDGKIVAEWKTPSFCVKTDEHGRKYYEISIDAWTNLEKKDYTHFT